MFIDKNRCPKCGGKCVSQPTGDGGHKYVCQSCDYVSEPLMKLYD